MQDVKTAPEGTGLWEDGIWDELLDYIEDQRVVPIIGPDLLQVQCDGQSVLLDRYIAGQLCQKYGIGPAALAGEPSLNDVVCHLIGQRGRESVYPLYPAIRQIVSKAALAPPRPLVQLGEITHFNLFVTTYFDSLLEDAINQARFGGRKETDSIAYAPSKVADLESPREHLRRPTVYHLLGKLSTAPQYVISEEDLLEFVHALQSDTHCPERLFDELERSHLLILGGNFSDWLARFFLRTAKRHRLSDNRPVLEILADSRTRRDTSLVLFLQHFSSRTRLYREGGAIEFVDALWRRWKARNPEQGPGAAESMIPPAAEMPPGSVFISYAHEDEAAVRRLKAGLDKARVPAWFDFDRLHGGDFFPDKIEENIKVCSCFVAVLSRHTEARDEGYFRREWHYATERAISIHRGKPFIIPLVVDDTPAFFKLPNLMQEAHRVLLPEGLVTPEFVSLLEGIMARA